MSNDEKTFRSPPFLAHGLAVTIAGRLDTIEDPQNGKKVPLSPPVPIRGISACLPVNGGESRSEGKNFQTVVREEGPVVEFKYARATVTSHLDGTMVQTIARTEATDLALGAHDAMRFGDSGVELKSMARTDRRDPPVFSMNQHLSGVEYRGKRLHIEFIDIPPTYAHVVEALNKQNGLQNQLLPYSRFKCGDAVEKEKPIALHIVKHLDWPGFDPVDAAGRRPNGLRNQDIGHVYFGELLITPRRRRFTLLRFELGSHIGGTATGHDVEDNGEPNNYL